MEPNDDPAVDEPTSSRRRLLATAGAAGGTFGAIGTVSAQKEQAAHSFSDEEVEAATAEYQSADAAQSALQQADDALKALAADGVLDSASVKELGISTFGEPASKDDALVYTTVASDGGEPTPEVVVQKEFDGTLVDVTVRPELDQSFAIAHEDGETLSIYCDCDDDCDCTHTCYTINNSAQCPSRPGYGYDVRWSCDCPGW